MNEIVIETNSEAMLNEHEARILGCLMEKQLTTPDYYPLTLKALLAACNQKSSRTPVMNKTEGEVSHIVSDLRKEGLVTARMDGRADRFEQQFSRKLKLPTKERAILTVLMLRGSQTLNELRINTSRMADFTDTALLTSTLQILCDRDTALVIKLPRASGQREERFAHLLCGEPAVETHQSTVKHSSDDGLLQRITLLETQVETLQQEVRQLKTCVE
ncbi:MAG: YceH family protein [Mariprofundaceae bacterium]